MIKITALQKRHPHRPRRKVFKCCKCHRENWFNSIAPMKCQYTSCQQDFKNMVLITEDNEKARIAYYKEGIM